MCSTGPLQYFFRGCVSDMFVTSYSVTYCIYIPEKPGFVFIIIIIIIIIVQFMMSANGSYSFICTLHHLIIINVQSYLKTLNS